MHLIPYSISICFSLRSVLLALLIKDEFFLSCLFCHPLTLLVYFLFFLHAHFINSPKIILLVIKSVCIVCLTTPKSLPLKQRLSLSLFLFFNQVIFIFKPLFFHPSTVELIHLTANLSTHYPFDLFFQFSSFFQFQCFIGFVLVDFLLSILAISYLFFHIFSLLFCCFLLILSILTSLFCL